MKILFLKTFPRAFTDSETQQIIVDLFPEWQNLLKNQRNELVEIILDRNVVNREILKKVKKVIRTYMLETRDYLTSNDVALAERQKFLLVLNSFAETLTKANYYTEFSFWPDLINCQISILKEIAPGENLEIYIKTLSNLLQSCLKFNFHSQDLLELFFKANVVDANSISSMIPSEGFQKDLLLYYAGICGYEE